MPSATDWTPELDDSVARLLLRQRVTLREAAQVVGVSPSVLAKRAYVISEARGEVPVRRGREALPPGHPTTWGAVVENTSEPEQEYES